MAGNMKVKAVKAGMAKVSGKGKIRACLEANKDKLALDCKTALEGDAAPQGQ